MAKKKAPTKESRPFVHEILGILAFTLGAFVFLSLFSYSPSDPSFNSASHGGTIHNYGGFVGSYLADTLITIFGLASYLVGLLLFLGTYLSFTKTRKVRAPELVLLFVFLVMAAILFQLKWNTINLYGHPTLSGGLVGALLGEQLRKYLSEVGSYLLVSTLGLLAFLWATKISVLDLFKGIGKLFLKFYQSLEAVLVLYRGRLEKWLAKRREEQERRAQERELEAKQRAERERKLKINLQRPPRPEKANPLPAQKAQVALAPVPSPGTGKANLSSPPPEAKNPGAEPKIFKKVTTKVDPKKDDQLTFGSFDENFELPALGLLDAVPANAGSQVDEDNLKASAMLLENKMKDYNVEGRVTEIHPGPVVTMYEFEPAAGVKVNKIVNLADDLSLTMGGRPVRIVAPLPGKPAVGIEIPNTEREMVFIKEIIADGRFQKNESKLALALGKNIEGAPVVADLAKMPHLLVAGATGAGKSVGLNSMILSLLLKNTPHEVRFIFIDPKMLELSVYADIPHLLLPVVTQPKKATLALAWAVKEMERRYRLLSDASVRNINSYNKKFDEGLLEDLKPKPQLEGSGEDPLRHEERLPYIMIIIDELADLMMVSGREIEEYITRLAQMARAAGIHMILATQRPSVDVITGVIKANFPSRIAFKVTSKHDSRTILDSVGAEQLLGNGDMLFIPPGLAKQQRVHGAFVSDQEIQRVVKHAKDQCKPIYNDDIMNMKLPSKGGAGDEEETDDLYDQAVAIVTETRQASISMVQRRLRIGYNRAARLIEQMEAEGIVSAPMGSKGREVLVQGYGTDG
ncbi:MAG: DNA translocase FtsK 4TM domain-containing protein [bacterium]|nr:DNA translocase FtsK 4TM domain-containing protein [bacterium]